MNKIVVLAATLILASCASKSSVEPVAPVLHTCPLATSKQEPKLIWSAGGFSAPESVVYDNASRSYFVSNVVGSPVEKDGQGWISRLSKNGKILQKQWSRGLNAPKGLRLREGILWTADIDQVVGIQTRTAKKTVTIDIPGAKFLNDIVFSATSSEIFVSDMLNNKIHAIQKTPIHSVLLEGPVLESPNGLVARGDTLLVASWGHGIRDDFSTQKPGRILSIDVKTKKVSPWSDKFLGHLDGIEWDGDDAVIVSDWMAGKVYRLQQNGACVTLLEGFKGSADIGFVVETRTLVIPVMGEDRVVAYKVPVFKN